MRDVTKLVGQSHRGESWFAEDGYACAPRPAFVRAELRSYLDCGLLRRGFASLCYLPRARCRMVVATIEELIERVLRREKGAWQEFSQVVESALQEMLRHWFRRKASVTGDDTEKSDDSDRSEAEDPEAIRRRLIDRVKRRLRADKFKFLATILDSCRKHADNPDRQMFLYWLGFLLRSEYHRVSTVRWRGADN